MFPPQTDEASERDRRARSIGGTIAYERIAQSKLRLSAQRAFLGRVHPEMRHIRVTHVGSEIVLRITLRVPPTNRVREDVSEAAAEIIADFPEATRIKEFVGNKRRRNS